MTVRLRKDDVIGAVLLVALGIVILAPLLTMIVWAFADQWRPPALLPTQWGVRYWTMLLARADVIEALAISFFISLTVTVVAALICLPAAYAFARLEFPGRKLFLLSFIAV